jgi:hypothetical protein
MSSKLPATMEWEQFKTECRAASQVGETSVQYTLISDTHLGNPKTVMNPESSRDGIPRSGKTAGHVTWRGHTAFF